MPTRFRQLKSLIAGRRLVAGVLLCCSSLPISASSADVRSRYYGESWALLIGIDSYKDARIPALRYAGNDVREMSRALGSLGFRVVTLLDADATKTNIDAAFQRLARLSERDRLIVFFSGHGESVRLAKGIEEGFLVPYDADRTRLVQTGIPMRDIDRLGERLPPKHILFVLDACHSGFAFVGFRDIEPEAKGDAYYVAATTKPVVQVLTAGETGQKAVEREGHGVFTHWLVQGLKGGADLDGDGIVTANELATWVEPHVTRESRGIQKPVFGRLFGEGQFVFELQQSPSTVTKTAPSEPRARVVPRAGSVLVRSSVAPVDVMLGDRVLGQAGPGADLLLENIAAGTHELSARASTGDFRQWRRRIEVRPDAVQDITIDLEQTPPPGPSARRGWLGISIQPLTPELAKAFGFADTKGALVSDVIADSPAGRAGLQPADILMEFEGKKLETPTDLQRAVGSFPPGQAVTLAVWRQQRRVDLTVRVGEAPAGPPADVSPRGRLTGLEVRPITTETARQLKISGTDGVVVDRVEEKSSGAEAGLQRGDVIREINRQKIRSVADYERVTGGLHDGDRVTMLIQRGPVSLYIAFSAGKQ